MGGKNPAFLMVGLVVLLAALVLYLWTVMSENNLLKLQSQQARDESGKLMTAKKVLQKQVDELSLSLDDKKRHISDTDAKLLKASSDLEKTVVELKQCLEQKKQLSNDAEKQNNELKTKEDQRKNLEEEKKKLEATVQEFKKLCTQANTIDLLKKLCS